MSENVDAILDARWVIPVEPAGVVLQGHSLAVKEGAIVALAPTGDINARFATDSRVSLPDHVLMPGLINLHTHAAMSLMRGIADDRALMEWLRKHIWPVETRLISTEFVYDGTLLACAEMLRGGVTCFNDMYFYPDAAAEAALRAGMRAALGMIVIELPSAYAGDARDYLAKGLSMRDALRGEPLLSFCLAPHAPYTVSDAIFERIATYSAELDVPVHIHLHETLDEIHESVAAHGVRPIARLQRLGILNPGLIGVHAVHLEASEIQVLAQHGCSVAHCPSSNLKLGSGIAPVTLMTQSGMNIGLGTDGAASNNRLDVMSEMRTAALLAKGASGDPTMLPAHEVIRMATLNGARALGIDQKVGSLAVGKRADLVAMDLSAVELEPCFDPASHIVYAAGREHVSHVWVDGSLRVREGELVNIDVQELKQKAALWQSRIQQ